MPVKNKTSDSQISVKLLLLFVSIVMALALSETMLQLLHRIHPDLVLKKKIGGNHPADLIRHSDTLDYELAPNFSGRDINPYGDFDVSTKINSQGFRDFERKYDPAHSYLMVVGDSIMYGEGVELEESFPALLEKRLWETTDPAIQIIKAGVPGYSERQALELLEARFDLFKPNIVILGVTPTEAWRNSTGYRNEQGFIVDSRLKKQYFRFGNELFASEIQNRPLAYLEAWSEAHFLLPTFIRQRRKFLREKFLKKKTENGTSSEEKKITPEELSPTLGQLDRFVELSHKLGFSPVVFIKGYNESAGKTISDYANAKGAFALDLAPLFKVGEGKVLYAFPHDGHWNASTHRMVSEILYNFLMTQKLIPEKIKAA